MTQSTPPSRRRSPSIDPAEIADRVQDQSQLNQLAKSIAELRTAISEVDDLFAKAAQMAADLKALSSPKGEASKSPTMFKKSGS